MNTRFSKSFNQLGIKVNGTDLEKQYQNMLNHNYYKISHSEELLNGLNKAGVTIIAATNGVKKTQINRLKGAGLIHYFDNYFISEDIGYNKPDPRFFTPIFRTYPQLTKSNSVMIGDRISSDILGANNAGLHSIWFNSNHQEDYSTNYQTASYKGIKKIILNQGDNNEY